MEDNCKEEYCTCKEPMLEKPADKVMRVAQKLKEMGITDPKVHKDVLISQRALQDNLKLQKDLLN